MDTRVMSYTEHGDYIRIFRIGYTKPVHPEIEDVTGPEIKSTPVFLASKIFMPAKKSETVLDIKQRIQDWVNQVALGNPYIQLIIIN